MTENANIIHEYLSLIQMTRNYLEQEKKFLGDYACCILENKDEKIKALSIEDRKEKLRQLQEKASCCTNCRLSKTRTQVVFGGGDANADLVLVGEAPGYNEDKQGLAFVGEAGQLLTKMLAAIHINREDTYICNVIKCRPPKNRNPEPDEISACQNWLSLQLELLQPKLLCALGKFSSAFLTGIHQAMWEYRGKLFRYQNIPVICTYHPAYLLYNPEEKKKAWQDLKMIQNFLDNVVS